MNGGRVALHPRLVIAAQKPIEVKLDNPVRAAPEKLEVHFGLKLLQPTLHRVFHQVQILLLGIAERGPRQVLQERRWQRINPRDFLHRKLLRCHELHLFRIGTQRLQFMAKRDRQHVGTLARGLACGLGYVSPGPFCCLAGPERASQGERGQSAILEQLGPVFVGVDRFAQSDRALPQRGSMRDQIALEHKCHIKNICLVIGHNLAARLVRILFAAIRQHLDRRTWQRKQVDRLAPLVTLDIRHKPAFRQDASREHIKPPLER